MRARNRGEGDVGKTAADPREVVVGQTRETRDGIEVEVCARIGGLFTIGGGRLECQGLTAGEVLLLAPRLAEGGR